MLKKGIIITLCMMMSAFAFAQDEAPKPPKQAIDACVKKSEGDNCSMAMAKKPAMEGVCIKVSDKNTQLACAPKPPKEAVDACKGKVENDKCTIQTPKGESVKGSCEKGPAGVNDMACAPDDEDDKDAKNGKEKD